MAQTRKNGRERVPKIYQPKEAKLQGAQPKWCPGEPKDIHDEAKQWQQQPYQPKEVNSCHSDSKHAKQQRTASKKQPKQATYAKLYHFGKLKTKTTSKIKSENAKVWHVPENPFVAILEGNST